MRPDQNSAACESLLLADWLFKESNSYRGLHETLLITSISKITALQSTTQTCRFQSSHSFSAELKCLLASYLIGCKAKRNGITSRFCCQPTPAVICCLWFFLCCFSAPLKQKTSRVFHKFSFQNRPPVFSTKPRPPSPMTESAEGLFAVGPRSKYDVTFRLLNFWWLFSQWPTSHLSNVL